MKAMQNPDIFPFYTCGTFSKIRTFKNMHFQNSVFSKIRTFKFIHFQKYVLSKIRTFKFMHFSKLRTFKSTYF